MNVRVDRARLVQPHRLLAPGGWDGDGTLVGCAGTVENRRAEVGAVRLQISFDPRQRRSCTSSLEDTWDEEEA